VSDPVYCGKCGKKLEVQYADTFDTRTGARIRGERSYMCTGSFWALGCFTQYLLNTDGEWVQI
jgi:hypothetical protein